MQFGLAYCNRHKLSDAHMTVPLGNYAEKNGFKTRLRLYLTTENKVETVDDSSSDSEDLPSAWADASDTPERNMKGSAKPM